MADITFDIYNDKYAIRLASPEAAWLTDGGFFMRYLRTKVSEKSEELLVLKESITYGEMMRLEGKIAERAHQQGCEVERTEAYEGKVKALNLYIDKRASTGVAIKKQEGSVREEYARYKAVVDGLVTPNRPLREKQMWDSFFMTTMKKSCNFSVPGAGKTTSVLGTYAYLRNKGLVKRIVMVGPKNSFGSWIDEFNICFEGIEKLSLFNIQDYPTRQAKIRGLMYESGGANLLLINYDLLVNYSEQVRDIIDDSTLLVFDEIHKIKRIDGQIANGALEIAENASYVIGLTGTPIPNTYSDIYNFLHVLFPQEYNEFFGFTKGQLKNPTQGDIEQINNKLQPFFCRTTKDQLGVPKTNADLLYDMNVDEAEQKIFDAIYAKYKKNVLALMIRLLQLESDPAMLLQKIDPADYEFLLVENEDQTDIDIVDYSDTIIELIESIRETTKMKALISHVCGLVGQGKTVIVWCIFQHSINAIKTKLEAKGIKAEAIYGEVDLNERFDILNRFKSEDIDVLITNPHTLAESVSLHSVCHDAIYFEYSYNLVHLLQSRDRIHRLGLPDGQYTQYYYLRDHFDTPKGPFSLDEKIYDRLMEKEHIMLDAIDSDRLEQLFSKEEDLQFIFGQLFDE